MTAGTCVYRECPDTTPFASAGAVTIETPTIAVRVEPVAGRPYFGSGGERLWSEGDEIRVGAIGGSVPPFAVVGPVPPSANILEARFTGMRAFDVVVMQRLLRGVDSMVSIDAAAPAVFLLRDVEGAGLRELRCEIEGGTGSVPLTLLPMFPPTTRALFVIATVTSAVEVVGEWTITVQILEPARTPEGIPAMSVVRVE
jgi:hypothetical protein